MCLYGGYGGCKDFIKQQFYCMECSQEMGKHEHKGITIARGMEIVWERWRQIRDGIERDREQGQRSQ